MNPKKRPAFVRQGGTYLKRLHGKWRRARGNSNKQRMHRKSRGSMPTPGYGAPYDLRYMHPSGFREVLINNSSELKMLDPKVHACRIATSVGKKKRIDIMKAAHEMKLTVLNPFKEEKK